MICHMPARQFTTHMYSVTNCLNWDREPACIHLYVMFNIYCGMLLLFPCINNEVLHGQMITWVICCHWYSWASLWHSPGVLCSIGYPSGTHLKPESREICCWSVIQLFWNLAQSTAVILPCSVENFKTVRQLERKLWTDKISQDFSLR